MAIAKRNLTNGTRYQVKVRGSDGLWITETFARKADAEKREYELKSQKRNGGLLGKLGSQITVLEYFQAWDQETKGGNISLGWRNSQIQYFHKYVEPTIGALKLQSVVPAHISRVLTSMAERGLSHQMRLHVYNLLKKIMNDAIDLHEILQRNPVKKALRPKVPRKEAKYLNVSEAAQLLQHVKGKPYEVAIYLGLFAGLRAGEIQSLQWEDIDFTEKRIWVRSTWVRKEDRIQSYPKGKQWRRVVMPTELLKLLAIEKVRSKSNFVAALSNQVMLTHSGFYKALKRYCVEAGVTSISPHGLRHSSSELYMASGANRDDLRMLYGHSTNSITDRYVHDRGTRLEKVAEIIRLFPDSEELSQNVPKLREDSPVGV